MNRMKTWQAALLAAVAVALAVGVIWQGTIGQKPPPIPDAINRMPQIPGSPPPVAGTPTK